jgi:hypothetical protein
MRYAMRAETVAIATQSMRRQLHAGRDHDATASPANTVAALASRRLGTDGFDMRARLR